MRNRGTADQEPGAARPARRADDADADGHDRARAGLGRAGGVHRDGCRRTSASTACIAPSWDYDWAQFEAAFIRRFGTEAALAVKGNHAVLTCDEPLERGQALAEGALPAAASAVRRARHRHLQGHRAPGRDRHALCTSARLAGTHVVGHTRMATESAVTPDRAHPFTAGEDFCLVHNGSLSNPYMIRRKLEQHGIAFETDNDTEAACRFLEWRMREGDDLEAALQQGLRRARRLLHVPDRHRATSSRWCATPSPASRRSWPRPTTTSPSPRSSARWPICRA